MEHRKSSDESLAAIDDSPAATRRSGSARSDLRHHVDAISLALKNWNDTEALKLLRLHWAEISRALCKPEMPNGIPVLVAHRDAVASAREVTPHFDEVTEHSSNGEIKVPAPTIS